MNYPNTNQISALLGRRIQPDYQSYIQPQVQALPQYLQLKEQRDYNNSMRDLEQQGINQQQSQWQQNFALEQEQADAAKKNQLIGNLISGAGLGLNAYQAMDESGFDFSGVGSALKSVLPGSNAAAEAAASGYNTWSQGASYPGSSGTPSTLSQLTGGVNDWVIEPAQQLATSTWDVAKDVGQGASNFVTETIPNAAKYVTGGDMWSDVSGFVEGLFS